MEELLHRQLTLPLYICDLDRSNQSIILEVCEVQTVKENNSTQGLTTWRMSFPAFYGRFPMVLN